MSMNHSYPLVTVEASQEEGEALPIAVTDDVIKWVCDCGKDLPTLDER